MSFAILATSWAIVLAYWNDLPETVPTHFGTLGQPDDWGPRGILFLLPGMGTLLFGLFLVIQRIPHRFNYIWTITPQNAASQYGLARRFIQVLGVLIQGLFAVIVYETVTTALGEPGRLLTMLTPLFLIAIFSLIIGYVILGRRSLTHQGGSP